MFKTIGDHVELQRGTTYKSALLKQPGPFLLGLGSIARDGGFRPEKLKTYGGPSPEKLLVYPGDLYVSLKDVTQSGDLLGSIARVPEDVLVGRMTQDTVKLCFKSNISKSYFYWLLRTPQYRQHCRSHATGTTNLGLSRDDFFAFEIPELTDDRVKITALLEDVESKININKKTNQTLEHMAQAIFKSWFVDFDPTRAKIAAKEEWAKRSMPTKAGGSDNDIKGSQAEAAFVERAAMAAISGRAIDSTNDSDAGALAGLDQLNPEQIKQLKTTAALFPYALVDSELGEVPEGWALGELRNIAEFSSDRVSTEGLTLENYISTENMLEGKNGISEASSLPTVKTVPSFKPGQILISNIRPYFMKIWLARFEGGRSNDVLGLEAKEAESIEYLYNLLYQDVFFNFMMTTSKGAKMPRGDKEAIMGWICVHPNLDIKKEYSRAISSFYEIIESNNNENINLEKTRDALLPKLLSGVVDLSGVDE